MTSLDPSDRFPVADRATIAEADVVAYEAVVARLASEHPDVPVSEVEQLVLAETEAMTGGAPIAVPAAVFDGVTEVLGSTTAAEAD